MRYIYTIYPSLWVSLQAGQRGAAELLAHVPPALPAVLREVHEERPAHLPHLQEHELPEEADPRGVAGLREELRRTHSEALEGIRGPEEVPGVAAAVLPGRGREWESQKALFGKPSEPRGTEIQQPVRPPLGPAGPHDQLHGPHGTGEPTTQCTLRSNGQPALATDEHRYSDH